MYRIQESRLASGSRLTTTKLALYAAGIILGAGVFNLPFQLPHVGLLPMVLLLGLMGIASSVLYPRMIDPDGGRDMGDDQRAAANTLASAVTRSGGGKPGLVLALVGAGFFVVPATIGYITIGTTALEIVGGVAFANAHSGSNAVAMVITVGLGWLMKSSRTPGPLTTTGALALRWATGVFVVDVLGLDGVARQAVLLASFVAGVIFLVGRPPDEATIRHGLDDLQPKHRKNVSTLVVQLVLMFTLAMSIVVLVALQGDMTMPTLVAVPSFDAGVTTLGVALFSFTGTGFTNISGYGAMRTRRGSRRIVGMSIGIVLIAQIGWLIAAGLTVRDGLLIDLNQTGSYSSVAMASAITSIPGPAIDVVQGVAAVLVLFAVSGAANGFTETLTREYQLGASMVFGTRGVAASSVGRTGTQRHILYASAVASILTATLRVPINSVLAAAGLAGGVVIMFALPILAEPDPQLRTRRSVAAFGIVLAVASLGIVQAISSGSGVVGVVVMAVPCVVVLVVTTATGVHVSRSAGPAAMLLPGTASRDAAA